MGKQKRKRVAEPEPQISEEENEAPEDELISDASPENEDLDEIQEDEVIDDDLEEDENEDNDENGNEGKDDGDDDMDEIDEDEGMDLSAFMKGADQAEIEEPSNKRKKQKSGKPPTADDMLHILETEQQFQSHLFRLQLEEMLKEVKLSNKKAATVEKVVSSLKEKLEKLPEQLISTKPGKFPEVLIVNDEAGAVKLKVQPPTHIHVIGSFHLRSQAKPNLNVDLSIQIPETCLSDKDIKKYRYFDKRALYVVAVAKFLKKTNEFSKISFTNFRGDQYKPIVVVEHKDCPGFHFRIIPCISNNIFKIGKLMPTHSNYRREEGEESPTPAYNNAILEDIFFMDHLKLLQKQISSSPHFLDVVLMLKVWNRQRNIHNSSDSFNGFLFSMLLSHLISVGKISSQMSSYHMFKLTLQYLAGPDFQNGIFMQPVNAMVDLSLEAKMEFRKAFPVVFVDPSCTLNLAGRISRSSFSDLQREAKLSLTYMQDDVLDGFEALFMLKSEFYAKFDTFLQIHLPPVSEEDLHKVPPGISPTNWQRSQILDLITRALSDRVELLRELPIPETSWEIGEKHKNVINDENESKNSILTIGILINIVRARSVIDIGPPADDPQEAGKYRSFWGEKAEVRRFKDGKIVVATLWECPESQKHLILHRIVQHVLSLHIHVSPDSVYYISTQLDPLLYLNNDIEKEDSTPRLLAAYDKLNRNLRTLEDLPLQVLNLHPISQSLRYTEVFSPQNLQQSDHVTPVKLVLQFEASSSWPDNLPALRKIKTAFYLKIGESLNRAHGLKCIPSPTFVEVHSEGFVFRIFIYHPKEILLLDSNPSTEILGNILKEEYVHRPVHSSTMHGFHMKFTAFGPTVRLALRWLHSHMFSNYFATETIELLVAFLFTNPRPYHPPANHLVGFYRFLNLLSTFEFDKFPIIVDFEKELKSEDFQSISDQLEVIRKTNSSHYNIFIATAKYKNGVVWTKDKPSKMILKRIIALARQSKDIMKEVFEKSSELSENRDHQLRLIFKPSLLDYNVIIQLKKEVITEREQNVQLALQKHSGKSYKSKKPKKDFQNLKTKLVDFHPVTKFVKELQHRYQERALFFYDELGGDIVTIVWKPNAFVSRPFKPIHATCVIPDPKNNDHVVASADQILNEIKLIGEGLIEAVQLNKK